MATVALEMSSEAHSGMYYDPNARDPLEAQKATLPLDVERRMLAVELAADLVTTLRRLDGPTTPEGLVAALLETAREIEEHLFREERSWALANMPYREYLQTCEWHEKRAAARARAGERCQVCNSDGPLDVHHRTYEPRGDEREEDLIVLCRSCHDLFHRFGRLSSGAKGPVRLPSGATDEEY
jgi:hypothetical protein